MPTPTGQQSYTSSCDALNVISGNGGLVPASVTLRVMGTDNSSSISRYRWFFGDGTTEETTGPEIHHRYDVSGTFTVRVEILGSNGVWKSSAQCQTPLTVQSLPVESHKSDCSDLFILSGNALQPPSTGKFLVTGYDNKGPVRRYKIDFGNGIVKENDSGSFEQLYDTAATYTIRSYVQDTQNNWKGSADRCQKSFYVSTKPLISQPGTGTPTGFTILAVASGIAGMSLLVLKKHRAH